MKQTKNQRRLARRRECGGEDARRERKRARREERGIRKQYPLPEAKK